ncbi:MAG: 3-hydroxyacyl-CoA dehydrogenase [Rhodospirillaceae bacterium]|nr:3-hydroxyacyl-CoA dehydrogenase [Rhodospirillaceae bacterium]
MAGRPVAVIGAGLVGSGWAIVFARAGFAVRVFDQNAATLAAFGQAVGDSLADLQRFGLVDDPAAIAARMSVAGSLAEAVDGVAYVQESVFERVDVKCALYEQLDAVLGPETIVGSSSSGIPASAFTEGLASRSRCLIAHPVNPPYLVPVVELVPAPWTDAAAVAATRSLMQAVGQVPVTLTREVQGFVLNRLQGALLREAWALFDEGYCSAQDIDNTVCHGLGLRWSFMGPFETIDLNAPAGVRDYAERLGGLYLDIVRSRADPQPWGDALVGRVEAERRGRLPLSGLPGRCRWRDQRLMALAAHKRAMAEETGE